MSETIKDVDSSPARGKTLERCSVSSATFFLVEKQGLQRPLRNPTEVSFSELRAARLLRAACFLAQVVPNPC